MLFNQLIDRLGLDLTRYYGDMIIVKSPIDGVELARLGAHSPEDVNVVVGQAHTTFRVWRSVPAPVRGELIRLFGDELRAVKEDLALLVTYETGKILTESMGEVQEMIDICDFAVGLSRQLYGLTIASERPGHAIREVWHPMGPVGVITAFNFPVAVFAWNAALAIVCGDPVVWKPSEKTPLSALATQTLFYRAFERFRAGGDFPLHLVQIVMGGRNVGAALSAHPGVPIISATGSTSMGRDVAQMVGGRLGRSILELGGNAAMIVSPSCDRNLALQAVMFGAVGTSGQRCTTLRRLIIHESIVEAFLGQLLEAYGAISIGDPRAENIMMGPLIDANAFVAMQAAIKHAQSEGGALVYGGTRVGDGGLGGGMYVRPAIVRMPSQTDIVARETFAPILYVMTYKNFAEAISMQNDVPQGLSSCIFTNHMREAELFCSPQGSDCGLANVNLGPSGAEIGGAFGGEKETGGGREAGSDAWKNYMRRQTQTVNYSGALTFAQGVKFGGS